MTWQQAFLAACSFTMLRAKTMRSNAHDLHARAILWEAMRALLVQFCPQDNGRGRPPQNLEMMIRICVFQAMPSLSAPQAEGTLPDERGFAEPVGLDFSRELASCRNNDPQVLPHSRKNSAFSGCQ